ncbi:hypothetical protein HJC23_011076 [Cyclotella cryptica]|uniref:RNA helicase n=1 Tax=Cyclotella cryptica TaxID=29204 RepID=A0ABD3NYY4_9STRA
MSQPPTDFHQQTPPSSQSTTQSLPQLYPPFATILQRNGYITPTPIQKSSSPRAKNGENLLLIAATGSGKTLAYLLPALSRIVSPSSTTKRRRTCLVVAPTRELAAQLARDASSLLLPTNNNSVNTDDDHDEFPPVLLAVRGIPPPTPAQLTHATLLVGTPEELYAVLTRIAGAHHFISGETLDSIVLDEVDVLLPLPPKTLRTSFDGTRRNNKDDDEQQRRRERMTLEQRRKYRAAQRRGMEFHNASPSSNDANNGNTPSGVVNGSSSPMVLSPTERILRLVASFRFVGGRESSTNEEEGGRGELQVLAGSATASRSTLHRLNKALRYASLEGGVIGMGGGMDSIWRGNVKICRADAEEEDDDDDDDDEEIVNTKEKEEEGYESVTAVSRESSHTIRAVTVPSVVDHRYVVLPKESSNNAHEILNHVARVTRQLQPETSLIFICGEFSRSITKEKKKEAPKARRDAKRRRLFIERRKEEEDTTKQGDGSGLPEPLSVRSACSILQSLGMDAQPMHVALGLEPNANEYMDDGLVEDGVQEVELPPVLVTFEGSARGLHFDGVDVVFVIGRPTSAASYLHLAGRVGRAVPKQDANTKSNKVDVRPGVIVSFCSKGRVAELDKWTKQVGGTELKEII